MKKIAMVLTNAFNPDVRVYKEARYFVEQGHEVTIYAWDRKCECKEYEEVDGIKVKRIQVESVAGGGVKQILPSIKFMKELKKILNKAEYDILYCHDFDGAIAGYFVGDKNSKFVFDQHEYFGEYFYCKIPIISKNLYNKILKKADYYIYVSKGQLDYISKAVVEKSIYLPNYPDSKNFSTEKTKYEKKRINYIGSPRESNGLKYLIDFPKWVDNVEINIYGQGICTEELKKYENENVKIHGRFDGVNEIGKLYQNTDITYIANNIETLNAYKSIAVKFYEAILTKTPIILFNKNTEMGKMVEKYEIGVVLDGYDINDTIYKINYLINNYANIVKNFDNIKETYSWDSIVNKLDIIL